MSQFLNLVSEVVTIINLYIYQRSIFRRFESIWSKLIVALFSLLVVTNTKGM